MPQPSATPSSAAHSSASRHGTWGRGRKRPRRQLRYMRRCAARRRHATRGPNPSGGWHGARRRHGRTDDHVTVIIPRVCSIIAGSVDADLRLGIGAVRGAARSQQGHRHQQQNSERLSAGMGSHGLPSPSFSSFHSATATAAPAGSRNTATFPFRISGFGATTMRPPARSMPATACFTSFTRT